MAEEKENFKFDSENRERHKGIAFIERLYKHILEPPKWLEGLECPFKWGHHIRRMEFVKWNIPDKLSDYNGHGAFYGFEKLAFLLTLLFTKTIDEEEEILLKERFELGESEDEDEGEKEEKEEEVVDEYGREEAYVKCIETVDEMARNEGDMIYSRIGPALQHVLQATRAFMLFYNGNNSESQELAKNIEPADGMSQECKAGFEGLRAKLVMSMVQDYTIVLPYLQRAMELDPNFGYWPYLVGKVLRRARREFDEGSIEEELEYFEKAVALERSPKFLVFLAQAYQEHAQFMFRSREPLSSVNEFNQKAVELYSECWELKNDSAAIARRVGNGMMKFRAEHINKTVAKEALLKAVELSPNPCTHIALGKFYYLHEKNDEKALEQFHKFHPSDFACSEIIRLNLIKDPNYDPIDILLEWIKPNERSVKQYRSFLDTAWYYIVYRRDLVSAAKFIWRVLVIDDKSIRAKRALEFRSRGFCVEDPINLIDVIVNEILLLKQKNKSLPIEERKDTKLLEDYLEKFVEKYPDLNAINPKPNMVDDLKRDVDRYIEALRRRRYGNGPSGRPVESGSWRNSRGSGGAPGNNVREAYRQQGGEGSRRYSQLHNLANRENYDRRDPRDRFSFSDRDDERGNRGYSRDDRRRHSESQSGWSSPRTSDGRAVTSNQGEYDRRFDNSNRGRTSRQYNSYNDNRYDVTVTNWRSENRGK